MDDGIFIPFESTVTSCFSWQQRQHQLEVWYFYYDLNSIVAPQSIVLEVSGRIGTLLSKGEQQWHLVAEANVCYMGYLPTLVT